MTDIVAGLQGAPRASGRSALPRTNVSVRPESVIVELGANWVSYPIRHLGGAEGARTICVEPDPRALGLGRHYAKLNGLSNRVSFNEFWISDEDRPAANHFAESLQAKVTLRQKSMEGVMRLADGPIELLNCDTRGAEGGLLRSAANLETALDVRFLLVSTHHESISGHEATHDTCLGLTQELEARVPAEHRVEGSFNADRLNLANLYLRDAPLASPQIHNNTLIGFYFESIQSDF